MSKTLQILCFKDYTCVQHAFRVLKTFFSECKEIFASCKLLMKWDVICFLVE